MRLFCLIFLLLLPLHFGKVLVVGSVNADIIVPFSEFPKEGETILALETSDSGRTVAGGLDLAIRC